MKLRSNTIRKRLRDGQMALGINVQTASPEVVEMVGYAGFDHVMIDWEHGSFGVDRVVEMIRAAEAVDITPIVRVPAHEEFWIQRVLDAGAMGVVIPQISTRDQAERVIAAARYFDGQNSGERGACPSVRAAGHLTSDWKSFTLDSNREIFVAISIESVEGIANFEEIASLPGMDAVFLGTFDLAHSMGLYGNSSATPVQDELAKLVAIAKAKQMPIFATLLSATPDAAAAELAKWQELGARVFNTMSDRRLIRVGLQARLESLRDKA